MDDAVLGPLNDCPVVTRELPGVVNHRAEWGAAFELEWCPGIPVANRVHGTVEVDFVHLTRAVVGIGVVPEEASFSSHLVR